MSYIRRITLFKIPSEQDIEAVIQAYEVLKKTNKKNGKPYIISCDASKVYNNFAGCTEGYTVAIQSTFANKSDVKYYDKECEAHKELKKSTNAVHQGVCMLLMESEAQDAFGQIQP